MLKALSTGAIADGFPAITDPFRLGVGQSMGGCFTIVQQAHHRSYDAIAVHQVSDADQLADAVEAGEHVWTWAFHHEAELAT